MSKNILWFKEIGIKDIAKVGGKNASLGEMYRKLTSKGVALPNGFAITAGAYNYFLDQAKIRRQIFALLKGISKDNLSDRGQKIRQVILDADLPSDLKEQITAAYRKLSSGYKMKNADVAVRSSATAEDLPSASFAGQQESYLNITGEKELLEAVKKCFASLFTDRAISYRMDQGFNHKKVYLSVCVQKMIRSDLATSGVMFTIDTESGNDNVILINAAYGLGEYVVKGVVNPDEYYIFKNTLAEGYQPIISRQAGDKVKKLIYNNKAGEPTKSMMVDRKLRRKYALADKEILQLAKWAMIIEKHYQRPMDIEWAKDGRTNKLFIVQARPETVGSQKDPNVLEEYKIASGGKVLFTGDSVGMKIGQGKSRVIKSVSQLHTFKGGEVLVAPMTDPDWEPVMKKAAAIVTDSGGRTCFGGETNILTNKGFLKFKDLENLAGREKLKTLSLNRETFKTEWKEILNIQKRSAELIKVDFSQSGRQKDNYLEVTPEHKFLTLENRLLAEQPIEDILLQDKMVLAARKFAGLKKKEIDPRLAYLWGAIFTDGSIYLSKTHGEVQFIQKPTENKADFIKAVSANFRELFGKELAICRKKKSAGIIRGKIAAGQACAYRCYSKAVAEKFVIWKKELSRQILGAAPEALWSFLAGVVDGDGSYSRLASRLNIYCSSEELLRAVVLSCLKLEIDIQVSRNRNISNIQLVSGFGEIFNYSKRIKGSCREKRSGTVLFAARQLLADIIYKTNYKGRIKPYLQKNLLLDADKIRNLLIPMVAGQTCNHELTRIVDSDLKMLRAKSAGTAGRGDVYNIEVADHHNYFVFTSLYTPIAVNNCHAAIVSRELGVPCVVGTGKASKELKNGKELTVSCAEGEIGKVYGGLLKYSVKKTNLKKLPRPKTKIMMNVGNPYAALSFTFIPNDGVGLAREEFIISNYIQVHPLALLNFSKIKKAATKKKIEWLTVNHKNKPDFFVDKLAEGVGMIAAAFYPKDVIIRLSDFKSNEYANLVGGEDFEPKEPNPMIGWRGASRYYADKYKDAFVLECKALKKAREEFGLKNIKIMIPFCRTIEEGKRVIKIMEQNGLKRGKEGLEVYVMCEIPANVILAEQFAEIFDGFSIGSNDLTQLALGVDRDSELVAHIYNEKNQAVKDLIAQVIRVAKKKKRKIGICGQAPSDFPDFAQFLVREGIDSMSLVPDTVVKTTLAVLAQEKKVRRNRNQK